MRNRKRFLAVTISCFLCFFSKLGAQTYGLVLSGGGGKGGYEVGVWKALVEYGIAQRTVVISGTSVGGLNAALFSICPEKKIEDIWLNEVPVELNKDGEIISQEGLSRIMNRISFWGLYEENGSAPDVYVTCTRSVGKGSGIIDVVVQIGKTLTKNVFDYTCRFRLNEETTETEIKLKLLATSAYPVLTSPVKLSDGNLYSDGGAADNTPVEPTTTYDVDVIFVVHLTNKLPKIQAGKWGDKKIIDIVPTRDMRSFGGMIDFSRSWAEDNINLGYADTVAILKKMGLNPVDEWWFF